MTSDPTFTPSPELVEGLAILNAHRSGWLWDDAGKTTQDVLRSDARATLSAAVAYRTPTGDPELVPWEQVRELVDALQATALTLHDLWRCNTDDERRALSGRVVQGMEYGAHPSNWPALARWEKS